MAKLTRSVTINAPVDKVFDFALDVGDLWTTAPDVAVRDVLLKADGVGSSARIYSHWLGIHMEGAVEYVEVIRNQRIQAVVTFGPEKPTWTFSFQPEDGATKFTIEGEWHFDVPGVGAPLEGLAVKEHEDMVNLMLANTKAAVEAAVA